MNPTLFKAYCAGFLLLLTSYSKPCFSLGKENNNKEINIAGEHAKPFTLPLTLLQFTVARTSAGKIELNWQTAQEINVSHFNIERSLDGRKWEKVGFKEARNQQGTITTYVFTDISPTVGANYYRLHVVDNDGRADYSPVRLATLGIEIPVRIYPTLAKGHSTIYVEGISPEQAIIEIVNNYGILVRKVRLYSNSSPGLFHIRISNIATPYTSSLQKLIIY
jgi:hypothetical protein